MFVNFLFLFQLDIDLSNTDTVCVLGHGNVALDVARILLSPLDLLKVCRILIGRVLFTKY